MLFRVCCEGMNGKSGLHVSEHWPLYLDMSACCLVSSLGCGGTRCYGRPDQPSRHGLERTRRLCEDMGPSLEK